MNQQQNRRYGFFITHDPAHCDLIRNACTFAVWVPHTGHGPLLGFGYSDQFREVNDHAKTACYEWEIGMDGRAVAKPVPSLDAAKLPSTIS
jgi:hypothetical protein